MKHRISSLLLTGIFLLCAGCAGPAALRAEEPASLQFFSMDTVMSITAYGEQGQAGVQAAREAVNRLDGLLSRTDPDSQISRLNAHAGDGTAVEVESDVAELLSFAQSVSQLLPGDFDITIAPVMDAWGFTTEERHVPTERPSPPPWPWWTAPSWRWTGPPPPPGCSRRAWRWIWGL